MKSTPTEKEKKEKKKKKNKKNTLMTSSRWRRDIYENEQWKALIKADKKALKKHYYALFDKGIPPEDIKGGIFHNQNELAKKLVLLMIKAKINSDEYGIDITREEVQPIIDKLREGGLL